MQYKIVILILFTYLVAWPWPPMLTSKLEVEPIPENVSKMVLFWRELWATSANVHSHFYSLSL